MFRLGLVVLLLVISCDRVAAQGAKASADSERKLLQGSWVVISIVSRAGSEEPQGRMTAQIVGNRIISKEGVKISWDAAFTLDVGKTPRILDLKSLSGGDKGKHYLGIYELAGNDLKLCFGPANGARPMEFSSNQGQSLIILKRAKK